jgi:hypothetical protein
MTNSNSKAVADVLKEIGPLAGHISIKKLLLSGSAFLPTNIFLEIGVSQLTLDPWVIRQALPSCDTRAVSPDMHIFTRVWDEPTAKALLAAFTMPWLMKDVVNIPSLWSQHVELFQKKALTAHLPQNKDALTILKAVNPNELYVKAVSHVTEFVCLDSFPTWFAQSVSYKCGHSYNDDLIPSLMKNSQTGSNMTYTDFINMYCRVQYTFQQTHEGKHLPFLQTRSLGANISDSLDLSQPNSLLIEKFDEMVKEGTFHEAMFLVEHKIFIDKLTLLWLLLSLYLYAFLKTPHLQK